ncbi:COG1361 S-layer family protein [Methanoregula sp.]|uniref:COG1361 S-layer family protein n=1 Tax=Methanoregula sp. TaxID=2052170 RepID=UPI000CADB123|nr:hypothetical protein [Methanoregula sp.]PKG32357.1 MAG: hypothetical protein CW742_08590 [Methanoregula sp.]
MRISQIITSLFVALLVSLAVGVASGAYSNINEDPVSGTYYTGKVYVAETVFDPGSFFSGDKGTVTYKITNGNANTSIKLTHVVFRDSTFSLVGGNYGTTTTLGPLQTRPFTFSILANGVSGDYYPTFSVSLYDSDLNHKTLVQIDNTPLELTVVDKPDAFTQGKKKTIYLQVANPRKNNVRNVILTASGAGITANPERVFIGDLAAAAKTPVNVSITPDQETTLILNLTYNNGDNPHDVTLEIPITFGHDKKQADPVMSNIQVMPEGMSYRVTGDVTNAGLETANAVMVTALSPAIPEDPYKTYVVQALKPDDFGSFEITFSTDGTVESIPVQISFKDSDGNVYTSVQNVTVPNGRLAAVKENGPPLVPIIAALVVVAIFVGGWYFYLRKKKQ